MNTQLSLLALLLFSTTAWSDEAPPFSSLLPGQALPKEFRIITLPKIAANKFSLVADEGLTVLRVDSDSSAGSLGVPLAAPRSAGGARTVLEWRWKVSGLLDRADMELKRGDDFPARVYVFFDVPLASLPFIERSKIRIARMVAGADVPLEGSGWHAACSRWVSLNRSR